MTFRFTLIFALCVSFSGKCIVANVIFLTMDYFYYYYYGLKLSTEEAIRFDANKGRVAVIH